MLYSGAILFPRSGTAVSGWGDDSDGRLRCCNGRLHVRISWELKAGIGGALWARCLGRDRAVWGSERSGLGESGWRGIRQSLTLPQHLWGRIQKGERCNISRFFALYFSHTISVVFSLVVCKCDGGNSFSLSFCLSLFDHPFFFPLPVTSLPSLRGEQW